MEYDYIVIGSGFGGSVASLRLVEKGYRVCVIEAGKRFEPADFPKTSWGLRKFIWAPQLFCYGIQRIRLLDDVVVLAGAGVGGGSLVYANTLFSPPKPFYEDPLWSHLNEDWKVELEPHFKTARQMLGVVTNPTLYPTDDALREYGEEIGRKEHFKPADVAVYFGEPGVTVPDPYFDGKGPERTGCTQTGHCMVGCRDGGKNTLDKNYLYLAEQAGLDILPEHKVIDIEVNEDNEYLVSSEKVTDFIYKRKKKLRAKGIVFAAGVLGTLELMMNCKERGHLSDLSDRLGHFVRTNSETLTGVTSMKKDAELCRGIAITSGLFVNDHTHIELVRYPAGSDLMLMLGFGPMVDGESRIPRALRFIGACFRHPIVVARTLWPFGKAKRSIIQLVMQTLDNYLTLSRRRRWWSLFAKTMSSDNGGRKIPNTIPEANETARQLAAKLDALPQNALTESILNVPLTAHILGGCAMAQNPDEGVIDTEHKVFGYENMYVVDGSAIPANLGVNPSLTITAMAERAMSFVPPKKPTD